jgi:hypothetical protein
LELAAGGYQWGRSGGDHGGTEPVEIEREGVGQHARGRGGHGLCGAGDESGGVGVNVLGESEGIGLEGIGLDLGLEGIGLGGIGGTGAGDVALGRRGRPGYWGDVI